MCVHSGVSMLEYFWMLQLYHTHMHRREGEGHEARYLPYDMIGYAGTTSIYRKSVV